MKKFKQIMLIVNLITSAATLFYCIKAYFDTTFENISISVFLFFFSLFISSIVKNAKL